MALNLSVLNNLRPPAPVPSGLDRAARLLQIQGLMQSNQAQGLQLQNAQKKQDDEKRIHDAILSATDASGATDWRKASGLVASIDPGLAQTLETYANTQLDRRQADAIAESKIQEGQSAPQVGTPGAMTPQSQAVSTDPLNAIPVGVPSRELPRTIATQSAPIPAGFQQSLPAIALPTASGQSVQIQPRSAEQITAGQTLAEQVKSRIDSAARMAEQANAAELERNKPANVGPGETRVTGKGEVIFKAPPKVESLTPFEAWARENPNAKVSDWLKLEATNKPQASVVIQSVDDSGNKITKIVPRVAGTEFAGAPTAQQANRRDQADIVSNYADHILELIDKNPGAVGPIVGRIARGETVIGNVDPGAKALGTALASFTALQPILHGFRGGSQTVDHFTSAIGDQRLNAAALKASINEIKALAKQIREGSGVSGTESSAIPAVGGTFNGEKVLKVTKVP